MVDERSEIAGCYLGAAQNDIGLRSDVLDACPKAEGMLMMIRSMTPKVVAADEIGTKEDVEAIEYAMHCGCRMIVTAHGNSVEELRQKPVLGQLIQEERFERYIVLRQGDRPGLLDGIYDRRDSHVSEAVWSRLCDCGVLGFGDRVRTEIKSAS